MQQEVQYSVEKVGSVNTNILNSEDASLVGTYTLDSERFQIGYSKLTINIYNLDGSTLLATAKDVDWYTVRGNNAGSGAVQIEVDPVVSALNLGFLGDVYVDYEAYNNLFGQDEQLFVSDISSDRTEIRAKSLTLSSTNLRSKALSIYDQLNSHSYFTEIYLDFEELEEKQVGVNIKTEIVGGQQVVTFKMYKALPDGVNLKSLFKVLKRLGEPTRFKVTRTVKVIPDKIDQLRGPNFDVKVQSSNVTTDYLTYTDLLSYKASGSFSDTVNSLDEKGVHVSVDHSDFKNFVHFSSAVERLENARYKFELLWSYEDALKENNDKASKVRYQKLIDGLIANFDHYERYLYFESGSTCWPKVSSKRPFENVRNYLDTDSQKGYGEWWKDMEEQADIYDLHNEDILIGTIPLTAREDPNNEPYVTFVHMIGQHFDDLWIYAKAISDKYKADNRLNFGISKDLVKHAIEDLGIDLRETSQNMEELFNLDGVKRIDFSGIYQPMNQTSYLQEVYKRIYHNVPVLLKTKGTVRCVRVLLNCFGIPDDILNVKVYGGIDSKLKPYFSPGEKVFKYSDKVRTQNGDIPVKEYEPGENHINSFKENSVLSKYVEVDKRPERYSDDEHRVEIGFNVNEASSKYFRDKLKDRLDLNLEDNFGDPRNKEDQYGDLYKHFREVLLGDLSVEKRFQSPASIIRLAKYFDMTFFRLVEDFLPARTVLTKGVIVEDNLLHRNRYKGVQVSWESKILEASIPTVSISGSSGESMNSKVKPEMSGSWKYETSTRPIERDYTDGKNWKRTWTVNHVTESRTGEAVYSRSVFDDSPKYNGILSGSNLTVTEGWLTSNNPHHKSIQPLENYGICFYFLDLPEPSLCSIYSLVDNYTATCYLVSSSFGSRFYELDDKGNATEISCSESGNYYSLVDCNYKQARFVADSRSFADENNDAKGYMGWYERHDGRISFDSRDVEFLTPRPDVTLNKDSWWKLGPKYDNVQVGRYRFEIQLDYLNESEFYSYGQCSYSYLPGDFILSWRYIEQSDFPPIWKKAVWSELGDIVYRIKPKGLSAVEGVLPASQIYGTEQGYGYLILNLGVEGLDSIESFGIVTAADGYRGPWISGKNFIDADWFDCYDIWGTGSLARSDRWIVVSSSKS